VRHEQGRTACVLVMAAVGWYAAPGAVAGAAGALSVTQAWTPTAAQGTDTPLFMTIHNGGAGDLLLRARCTAANFSEQHTVDHGEGFPSMRTVKSIPIAADGVTRLEADGYHVMLLQTTRALAAGDRFNCSITFRDAGKQDIDVGVGKPDIDVGVGKQANDVGVGKRD
jgi:copper(I)-binding protein